MPSTSASSSPAGSPAGGGGPKVLGPAWGTVPDLRKLKLKVRTGSGVWTTFVRSFYKKTLFPQVIEGHQLARKDIFGASDPYVRVDLLSGIGSVIDSVT